MIPLFHDLNGKKVVIFGGGEVGFRKASFFYPEADVSVVSKAFVEEFNTINITAIKKDLNEADDSYLNDIIKGSLIVVAATSSRDLNDRIGILAKNAGVFFNNADGKAGDIIIPSVVFGKNFLIAVSTCGKSPAMSRYIRKNLEKNLPNLDEMIALQNEIRELIKEKVSIQKDRNKILRDIIDDEAVWEKLKENHNLAFNYVWEKYLQ
ncbi:MAG: bifunctional precorrin-2 dehydrogenase/sirohydrochlorin ferrochelatase [Methanomicrobium sp.]|nr:bifunctional precorrin-2 dehydrogenase/sirohydrochlorin ferrochelatase [Methanomicrobium sp.]